jgi:hypothetical protein
MYCGSNTSFPLITAIAPRSSRPHSYEATPRSPDPTRTRESRAWQSLRMRKIVEDPLSTAADDIGQIGSA